MDRKVLQRSLRGLYKISKTLQNCVKKLVPVLLGVEILYNGLGTEELKIVVKIV